MCKRWRRRGLDSDERWLVMVDEGGGVYAGRLRWQVFSGRGRWRSRGGRDQN